MATKEDDYSRKIEEDIYRSSEYVNTSQLKIYDIIFSTSSDEYGISNFLFYTIIKVNNKSIWCKKMDGEKIKFEGTHYFRLKN